MKSRVLDNHLQSPSIFVQNAHVVLEYEGEDVIAFIEHKMSHKLGQTIRYTVAHIKPSKWQNSFQFSGELQRNSGIYGSLVAVSLASWTVIISLHVTFCKIGLFMGL